MTIGELKKRIFKEGGNLLETIPSVIEIDREKLEAVIEEAKREFPFKIPEGGLHLGDRLEPSKPGLYRKNVAVALCEWFERWFGT